MKLAGKGSSMDDKKRATIALFIGNKLWEGVKFLNAEQLNDTGADSVCSIVAAQFNVPPEHQDQWWNGPENLMKMDVAVKNICKKKLQEK